MATFKAYPLGCSYGVGNPTPVGGKRGQIEGWSAGAVRRHTRWLYSMNVHELDGNGDAVTLTMREIPATSDEWRALLQRLIRRLRDMDQVVRWHWVVEWQRRGAPHVHLAVYSRTADNVHSIGQPPTCNTGVGSQNGHGPGRLVVAAWREVAGEYGVALCAQYVTPITGPEGWLQYLSKHAARGVRHYQRQGKPQGWQTTGRLWGHGGEWPTVDPVHGEMSVAQGWLVRRMVRRYAIAAARSEALRYERAGQRGKAAGAWRRVAYLRRMYKDGDRSRSSVRGWSEWIPGEVLLSMASWAGWQGELADVPA